VQLRQNDDHGRTLRARREVILAAGAIGSPQILQLSGVGPAAWLQDCGIPVLHDLPGVGENLHDHLQIRMIYRLSGAKTLNVRARSWLGKAAMGIEYGLFRTGPLTMPPSQLGAFARSDPGQAQPNLEWHVQPLSLDRFGEPLHRFDAMTPAVCNLQPSSRGHVRVRGDDAEAAPRITLNYLATEHDRRVAVAGMRFTRRIMAAPALAPYEPTEWRPGASSDDDAALEAAARALGTTIFHPVGSCKMGQDPLAVVDDRLCVHGVEGLRVIDASIMPRITSGNTHAPTVMIAEQGAEFVKAAAR
jgi:choline dehydrogenase